MADSIVDGLFGADPWQVQQAQQAALQRASAEHAQRTLAQKASQGMFQGGGQLMSQIAPSMGYVNPMQDEARMREQVMGQGGDLTTSAGLKAKAAQFDQAGDKRTAMKLIMAANEMEAREQKNKLDAARERQLDTKASLDIALAQKALRENPNLATATVGVKGRPGWKQLIIYDKTKPNDPYQEVGEPIESDKGTSVNVAAPVTPVTIQDPKNPDATIIVDGRTNKVIGVGPKLTQTGTANIKKQAAMEGLASDLKTAEDLLTGVATGSKPTSSGAGAAYDYAASLIGVAPEGSAEADELKVVAGRLVQKVPRFEGQQSDRDVQLYKESAADVGNSKIPIARRLAAVRRMKMLYEGYESGERGRIGFSSKSPTKAPSSAVDAALEKYK
jgi:hypothetical protein